MKFDLVEAWLNNVAISHSNSRGTRVEYKNNFKLFCDFIDKTPKQIKADYDNSTDRQFRRQYAEYIRAFMSAEFEKGLAPCTISCRTTAVKSFFKYNDMPLAYVPPPRIRVIYHNRDITHEELRLILDASRPRERAFYAILAQSGLRPFTICNLRFEHIKEDFIGKRVPCKIDIPQEIAKGKYRRYFTFIPQEAVKYLKAYHNTRGNITDNDFLFVSQGTKQQANPRSFSVIFSRTLQKLKKKGLIEVKQKARNKPRDVRLYSLRKFFRKHANQAGFEFVQFWMGHIVKTGQEEHYRPTDEEYHRKLYAEKAMPFLRIETATPTEREKGMEELREQLKKRDKEIKALKESVAKIQPVIEFVNTFTQPKDVKEMLDFVRTDYEHLLSSFDPNMWFDKPHVDKLDEIMKKEGITLAEALKRHVQEDWELALKGQEKFKRMAKARGLPMTREDYEKQKKKKARE